MTSALPIGEVVEEMLTLQTNTSYRLCEMQTKGVRGSN